MSIWKSISIKWNIWTANLAWHHSWRSVHHLAWTWHELSTRVHMLLLIWDLLIHMMLLVRDWLIRNLLTLKLHWILHHFCINLFFLYFNLRGANKLIFKGFIIETSAAEMKCN